MTTPAINIILNPILAHLDAAQEKGSRGGRQRVKGLQLLNQAEHLSA